MNFLFFEYSAILVFAGVSLGLSLVIILLSVTFSTSSADKEKLSSYECGFDPFEDARNQFDVRFYLVAILFIIFDLEASFIFPQSVSLGSLDSYTSVSFQSMFDFIIELVVGYVYAYQVGAFEQLGLCFYYCLTFI